MHIEQEVKLSKMKHFTLVRKGRKSHPLVTLKSLKVTFLVSKFASRNPLGYQYSQVFRVDKLSDFCHLDSLQ